MATTDTSAKAKKSDHNFKFVVIGDTGAGKSSVLLRFADNAFQDSYMATVAVDFRHRTVTVNGESCKLQIWDTAGQERYRTITSAYYRGADAIVMVYDVTNQESIRHINDWMAEVNRYAAPDTCKLLIGNKCDLESQRVVPTATAKSFAEELNIPFIETSAKEGVNVDKAFIQLTEALVARKNGDGAKGDKSKVVKLDKDDKSSKVVCC